MTESEVKEAIRVISGSGDGSVLYEDADFPPDPRPPSAVVSWIRPPCVARPPTAAPNGAFFVPGPLRHSSFVGAVAALLYSRPDALASLFMCGRSGGYAVRFFRGCSWRVVTVDSRLPCSDANGTPSFARMCVPGGSSIGFSDMATSSWLGVLEKAFAKVNGSYSAMSAPSMISDALYDLTGQPVFVSQCKGCNRDALWGRIKVAVASGFVVTSVRSEKESDDCGIATGAAYSVLSAVDSDSGKLCLVRCTIGAPEWKGAFSRSSAEFSAAPQQLRDAVNASPNASLMTFDDFVGRFTEIYVVETPKVGATMSSYSLRGEWRGASAGGCSNNPTWNRNPQWCLTLPKGTANPTRVAVTLSQTIDAKAPKKRSIGFLIAMTADTTSRKERVGNTDLMASSGTFTNRRDVTASFEAHPNSFYAIVPSTFDSGEECAFTLRIVAPSRVELFELPPWRGDATTSAAVCSVCGKKLASEEHVAGSASGKGSVYCKSCFAATERKCSACDSPILGDTVFKTVGEHFFHTDCFRCATCHSSGSKSKVAFVDGKLQCSECQRRCTACNKSIGAEPAVSVNGKLFHKPCLVCDKCKKEIGDAIFVTPDDKFICDKCQ